MAEPNPEATRVEPEVAPAVVADEAAHAPRRVPFWLTTLFILLLIAIIWLLYRQWGVNAPASTALPQVTPVAGGLAVTAAPLAATTALTTVVPAEPTQPPVLQPGQIVAASGGNGLRLYIDAATTAQVMDVYADGALFTVVEPTDAYGHYPVVHDEQQWYRLRAADGLVGWAMADALSTAPATPTK